MPRNIVSKYTAIYLAEYLLNWIPKGTHDHNKFIKPKEITDYASSIGMSLVNTQGLVYNPLEMNWNLSKFTKINYFCTLKKIN